MLVLGHGRMLVAMMRVREVVVMMTVGRRSRRRMVAAGEAHLEHRFQVAAAKLHPEGRDDGDEPPNSVGQGHSNEFTDSGRQNLLADSWPKNIGIERRKVSRVGVEASGARGGEIVSFPCPGKVDLLVKTTLDGDVDFDNDVDDDDKDIVLNQISQTACRLAGDVNYDGTVNFTDLNIVLANVPSSCP